jgi:hypothetical protein
MARSGATGIEVEGGPELQRAFVRLGARLEDLAGMYGDIADMVADEARDRAPVLTGALRDSVRSRRARKSASVSIGSGLLYGPPIHFGWRARNIEPQPFLYDALEAERDDIDTRVQAEVDDLIRRFDREAPA